jgi:hypothetical protein
MKTKIFLILAILGGFWFLNKVRIVVFTSMWSLIWVVVVMAICGWVLFGSSAVKQFMDKYDR